MSQIDVCTSCGNTSIINYNYEYICDFCGVVVVFNNINDDYYSNYNKTDIHNITYPDSTEHKNNTLKKYVVDFCMDFGIKTDYIYEIQTLFSNVLTKLKTFESSKRSNVKAAVLIHCICYVMNDIRYNITYMSKLKNINKNILSKVETSLLELINKKVLLLDSKRIDKTYSSYEYVSYFIYKKNLDIDMSILDDVKSLILYCDKNNLICKHTPISKGLGCFYYVLKIKNITLDKKVFSDFFSISCITINNIFKELNSKLKII